MRDWIRRTSFLHFSGAVGLVLVVLGSCADLEAAQASRSSTRLREDRTASWFPLRPGSSWKYVVRGAGEDRQREVRVLSDDTSESQRASLTVSGYFDGSQDEHRLRLRSSGTVVEVGRNGTEHLWYRFGSDTGESWVMDLASSGSGGCEDGVALILTTKEDRVSVPAGDFQNVIRIDRQNLLCADAGIVTEWFAAGVGLIRRVEQSIAGPVTSELVEAELGVRSLPAMSFDTALRLSSDVYVNDLMPPVDPEDLPVVRGRFVVRSRSGRPSVLEFTGCRSIRIELRNEEGVLVRSGRAQDGGCCACDSIVQIDLAEEDLEIPFSFLLSDDEGGILPDGFYALTAVAETSGAEVLQPAVRSRIEVQSTY